MPSSLTMPLPLRYVLAIVASVLSVLVQTTVFFSNPASDPTASVLTVILAFVAALGILPVVGQQFQDLLAQLVPAKYLTPLHALLVAAVAAAETALVRNGWSMTAHAIVAGVVSILLALGFGPPVSAIVQAVRAPR